MGETGADVKLSPDAIQFFPFQIECKNQEVFGSVYKAFEQANNHKGDGFPLLVIKKNRQKPLVILDADDFFYMMENMDWTKT